MFQSTLYKLSKILNDANIIWGIGGSTLLEYYGLYSHPNDLDIWIHPNDINKVKNLFENYKEIESNIYLPEKYHLKIHFYDIDVDFVACFMIKPNQHEFTFHISPDNLQYIKKDDMNIPITFLEDWYIIYKLLKREDKAKIIEDYFHDNAIELSTNALNLSLSSEKNTIPIKTINAAYSLMQLSLFSPRFGYDDKQESTHNIYLFDIPEKACKKRGNRNQTNLNEENLKQLSFFDLLQTNEEIPNDK